MAYFRFNTRSAIAALTVTATVCIASVALVGKPEPVQAFPAFSEKEGVKCGYCHIKLTGGGKRNYRGKFYKTNSLSFANFDDKAEAAAAGEPVGPEADATPKSLTVPSAPTATPEPPMGTPAPTPKPETPVSPIPALRKKVAATQAALTKSPKSVAAKKAHSASLTALARGIMKDPAMPPVKKYPEALKLVRQAVKLDPTNKNAAGDVKLIEGVYKKMGKPIPK